MEYYELNARENKRANVNMVVGILVGLIPVGIAVYQAIKNEQRQNQLHVESLLMFQAQREKLLKKLSKGKEKKNEN